LCIIFSKARHYTQVMAGCVRAYLRPTGAHAPGWLAAFAVLSTFFTGLGRFFAVVFKIAAAALSAFFCQLLMLYLDLLRSYLNCHDAES